MPAERRIVSVFLFLSSHLANLPHENVAVGDLHGSIFIGPRRRNVVGKIPAKSIGGRIWKIRTASLLQAFVNVSELHDEIFNNISCS